MAKLIIYLKMNVVDILRSDSNITLAISANDSRKWHKEVIEHTKKELEESVVDLKTETYLTAKQVCAKLNVVESTLWRWANRRYLVPLKVGGDRRYRLSDVESILGESK